MLVVGDSLDGYFPLNVLKILLSVFCHITGNRRLYGCFTNNTVFYCDVRTYIIGFWIFILVFLFFLLLYCFFGGGGTGG